MPAAAGVKVHGLKELNRAFARASKDARREVRHVEGEIAEPVRRDAESLASREISHIGTQWSAMRIGVTRKSIYVAPKRRNRGGSKRPNLAGLLMDKAMQPALKKNQDNIEARVELALDKLADHFNTGA